MAPPSSAEILDGCPLYGLETHAQACEEPVLVWMFESLHLSSGEVVDDGLVVGTNDNIRPWMEKKSPVDVVKGIRLIFVHGNNRLPSVPFSDPTEFADALQNFHPVASVDPFLSLLTSDDSFIRGFSHILSIDADRGRDGDQAWIVQIYAQDIPMRDPWNLTKTSLMISYHSQTNIVSVFGIFSDVPWMRCIMNGVRRYESHACHPALVLSLIASDYAKYRWHQRVKLSQEVASLERKAGVRAFSGASHAESITDAPGVTREAIDLKARLLDFRVHVRPMETCILDPVLDGIKKADEHAVRNLTTRQTETPRLSLRDRIIAIKRVRAYVLEDVEVLITKTDNALSALYNMFAQRDSKLNLAMAKDSRDMTLASQRDSSAMKSITIVTTLFLPGTYVATLLAMPTVDWDPPEIWRYWVITIPLTALVMGTWYFYMSAVSKHGQRPLEKAEESTQPKEHP